MTAKPTPQDAADARHRRLAQQLAEYEAKASAKSVSQWLDWQGLEGADRLAVLDLYKRGEEA